MELLLNLIWLALAVGALAAFARGWLRPAPTAGIPCRWSLVALACVLLLLFPVISASDDLHPAQAVFEDASKKLQLTIAPPHLLRTSAPLWMLPSLALGLLFTFTRPRLLRPVARTARALDGAIIPSVGRAPPSHCN